MRVVVDTNVFVSSLLGERGASRQVIRLCLQRKVEPLMGAGLFAEYEELLNREELLDRSPLSPRRREEVLDGFLAVCRWTRIYYRWRPNLTDEADNHVVELAVAGGAAGIITKNVRDFGRSELHFPDLRIWKPEQFLSIIE